MPKAKDPSEENAIQRFRAFLDKERGTTHAITGRDVVVNPANNQNFDYQLQNTEGGKLAVEVFRLVEDGGELARQKVFGDFVESIKKELLSRGVKGYFISTPEFVVNKRDIPVQTGQLAAELEQAVRANSEAKKFECGTFELTKIKDLETVVFSYHGSARNVDAKGTAATVFATKLPTKNKQVAISDHERMLLVVNWTMYIDGEDAIRALSGFDFSAYENIDKIYFERRENEFVLVYDRTVIDAIENKQPLPESDAYQLMLRYARYQLGEKKPEAYDYVKAVSTLTGNTNWLADNAAKENLISYAEDLVAKDALEEAMWVVRQLENDQNPKADGSNDDDDPDGEYNYHKEILLGDEVRNITSVRGRLCWLMMKIAAKSKPHYYSEIIKIMSRYLSEDNLYIRTQAIYPLGVFWSNRLATKNPDESPFDWSQEERVYIRELTLSTIRANQAYPRVMQILQDVFRNVRDLNEKEAEEMLGLFIKTNHDDVLHDTAAYLTYFAFFRETDAQFYKDEFRSEKFIALLKEQIRNGKDSMRSSLAWHIWKLLTDKTLPYETLKEYIWLFLEGNYASGAMNKLALMFPELAKIAPNDALPLFEKALEFLQNHLTLHPEEAHQHYIEGVEEMLPLLAKEPVRLQSLIGRLKDIWMMGRQIYIGDIKTIFESYTLVAPEEKVATRTVLKVMYGEMKAAWPHIQEVDWSL